MSGNHEELKAGDSKNTEISENAVMQPQRDAPESDAGSDDGPRAIAGTIARPATLAASQSAELLLGTPNGVSVFLAGVVGSPNIRKYLVTDLV